MVDFEVARNASEAIPLNTINAVVLGMPLNDILRLYPTGAAAPQVIGCVTLIENQSRFCGSQFCVVLVGAGGAVFAGLFGFLAYRCITNMSCERVVLCCTDSTAVKIEIDPQPHARRSDNPVRISPWLPALAPARASRATLRLLDFSRLSVAPSTHVCASETKSVASARSVEGGEGAENGPFRALSRAGSTFSFSDGPFSSPSSTMSAHAAFSPPPTPMLRRAEIGAGDIDSD